MTGPLARAAREPLVHFFVLGALLLAVATLRGGDDAQGSDAPRIVVDDARLATIRDRWSQTHGRAPTEAELAAEVEAWVRESVLVAEAQRLELGADDPLVRAHLAEQMTFLLAAWEVPPEPDEAELRAAWEAWQADLRRPARLTLRQWALAADAPDHDARVAAAREALEAGAIPSDAGEPPPGGPVLRGRRIERLTELRGERFATRVAEAEVGDVLRFENAGTTVLVRVEQATPGGVIPFDEARARVAARWQAAQIEAAREAAYQALRDGYRVDGWPR